MIIKNITGANGNAVKVIGIGSYWIQPDEEKLIPDSIAYIDEVDGEGKTTGNKIILPAIQIQAKMGVISIKETPVLKKEKSKADAKSEADVKPTESVAVEEIVPNAEPSVEDKKAAAAAKRAATRAANKAAKEAAAE